MGSQWWPGNWERENRLRMMIVLTGFYFWVELIVGHASNCVALTADAFHVLSDCLALVITLISVKAAARKPTEHWPFGWQRAELVGALVNAVFLLALCFSIVTEAVPRLWNPEETERFELLVSTATLGLIVNLVGLLVFREHGHVGCTHGHSHGGEAHSQTHDHSHAHSHGATPKRCKGFVALNDEPDAADDCAGPAADAGNPPAHSHAHSHAHAHAHSHAHPPQPASTCDDPPAASSTVVFPSTFIPAGFAAPVSLSDAGSGGSPSSPCAPPRRSHRPVGGEAHAARRQAVLSPRKKLKKRAEREGESNRQALVLHIIGDALASAAVIVAALVMWKATWWKHRHIVDPILSLVIAGMLVKSALTLAKKTVFIMLQGAPDYIGPDALLAELSAVPHVKKIEDLAVWQLTDMKCVGTCRVYLDNETLGQHRHLTAAGAKEADEH
eukprot:gene15242-23278_t